MTDAAGVKPMTVPRFRKAKGRGTPLVVLTAYDYPTAKLFDGCGVDALLVGDTVGVVIQGKPTTVGVTMDQMVYHVEMVARAAARALVIADMPFLSYQADRAEAIRNAGRLVKEGGAQAVKLEGGVRVADTVAAVVDAQIPVMGHVGLLPQSVHAMGGYRLERDFDRLTADVQALEKAGVFAIVFEGIPAALASRVSAACSVPTIGIGAGPGCDGQVLVWTDALGLTDETPPRFVERFGAVGEEMKRAVTAYAAAVRDRSFPAPRHGYEE
ncbi:MAG: 3-methyl-2-oxobutanoate hydroxymethyltransferase [Planctomycetia bacterium]